MKKTLLAQALILASVGASPFAVADQAQEIQSLKDRIEKLEAKKGSTEGGSWADRVTISGLIEIEASYEDPDSGLSSSDLVVATAELGVEAAVTDEISTNIVLLHEEDDTDLEVDVATISYQADGSAFSFVVGQEYVPFGVYETALVNDTLALEIGETRETAFIVNYEAGLFTGSLYIFNGDQDEDDKDTLQNFGASIGVNSESFSLGADYISNLADSDGLQENDYGYDAGEDAVAGASFHASASLGNVTLMTEYLTALDEFANDGNDSEPNAFQVEAAVELGAITYAVSYQETDEAVFLELPEERISVGLSTEVLGGLGLGIQFQHDEDYSAADGGSDEDTDSIVIQLAAEF